MLSSVEISPPVLEKNDFEGFFFTIYGHGGHLGHVTWIIYIHFGFSYLKILLIKVCFDWPSGFRIEDLRLS